MMRWILFAVWVAVTVSIVLFALSDFIWGKGNLKKLGTYVALAFVWPLAALSKPGRDYLFNIWREE